jgi:hypothetical protein
LRASSSTLNASPLSGRASSIRAHHASALVFTAGEVAVSSPCSRLRASLDTRSKWSDPAKKRILRSRKILFSVSASTR